MNIIIEKLFEEATIKSVAENFDGKHITINTPSKEWAEKFAELIIRECGDIALKMENHPLYEHHDCMLTHFGFE